MSTYAVNSEGVEALKKMAQAITDSIESIQGLITKVQNAAEENGDSLGPHRESLNGAIETIQDNIKQAADPAASISEKLNSVAEAYEEVIGNDLFSSGK